MSIDGKLGPCKPRNEVIIYLLGVACVVLVPPAPGLAWDAGSKDCTYSECSGGENAPLTDILDTRPAYAVSSLPITNRAADCPAGYTNTGLTCYRGPEDLSAPSFPASCPGGYTNTGLTCYRGPDSYGKGCTTIFKEYSCASGYTDMGCHCQRWASSLGTDSMSCPSGYFINRSLGRCYKNCAAGYTNTGEFCHRDASSLGLGSMSCKANEVSSAGRCYACASGTEYYGGLCYNKCPAGSVRTAVSTCKVTVKWRGNTHLWVVQRALDLLAGQTTDSVATAAVSRMRSSTCQSNWRRGLWDADASPLAEDPTAQSRGSHFYNAAQHDAWGNPTNIVTYAMMGIDVTLNTDGSHNPNARDSARSRLARVSGAFSDADCYQLGIALHYLTDMTQPMHATSFSAADVPTMLHAVWEEYVPWIQARFPITGGWSQRWKGKTPDDVFVETALQSASWATDLMDVLVPNNGITCSIIPQDGVLYSGYCFPNDPSVDAMTGSILRDGYQSVASYIHAVFASR